MVILVNGATETHRRYAGHPQFGYLLTPRNAHSGEEIASSSKAWGADNDAFGGWTIDSERMFSKLLGKICVTVRLHPSTKINLKFIAAPDALKDPRLTRERFDAWEPIIHASNLPVAYVLQDGEHEVPWDRVDALFVGGSTEYKLSSEVDQWIDAAKCHGKWVHIGRVNTKCRLRHFFDVGADSIDGTFFSKWPDVAFASALKWLRRLEQQPSLRFAG